jgi:hypothetical protein
MSGKSYETKLNVGSKFALKCIILIGRKNLLEPQETFHQSAMLKYPGATTMIATAMPTVTQTQTAVSNTSSTISIDCIIHPKWPYCPHF